MIYYELMPDLIVGGAAGRREPAQQEHTTDFPLLLKTAMEKLEYPPPGNPDEFLKYNQYILREYVKATPELRGLLIFVKMGYGKSIISAAISYEYHKLDPDRSIICVMPKGLINNFKGALRKYFTAIGLHNIDELIALYKFVSIGASNMYDQVVKSDIELELDKQLDIGTHISKNSKFLERSLIIIDEAHNLFNSVANGSRNAVRLYDAIMNTKDIKLLFMTGTPIINSPFELVPCFNMLRGWIFDDRGLRYSLFPESRDKFVEAFVDPRLKSIKNRAKFQNRILGMLSYYGDFYVKNDTDFPRIIHVIEKIPMSLEQYAVYDDARDRERAESSWNKKPSGARGFSQKDGASTSYRFKSRQACNFVMPEHALGPRVGRKKRADLVDKLDERDLGLEGLAILSPKLARLSANLDKHAGTPGIIYSEFKSRDLAIIARHLELTKGFHKYDSSYIYPYDDGLAGVDMWDTYALMTSDVSIEERKNIVDIYSSDGNVTGGKIALLLISEAASEGVDTRSCRHVHVFEPYWNYARVLQVIYRAVRYKSHAHLPADKRNVTVYIYLSDYPANFEPPKKLYEVQGDKTSIEQTTDVYLYEKAKNGYTVNQSFEKAMAEASVDCHAHYAHLDPEMKQKYKCVMCMPTGQRLYHPSLEKDLALPNPCEEVRESKVIAKEIKSRVTGESFYYTKKGPSVLDVDIYKYDPMLKGYVKLKPSHPQTEELLNLIAKDLSAE